MKDEHQETEPTSEESQQMRIFRKQHRIADCAAHFVAARIALFTARDNDDREAGNAAWSEMQKSFLDLLAAALAFARTEAPNTLERVYEDLQQERQKETS